MTVTLTPTNRIILCHAEERGPGILCRVWEGSTSGGIKVHALIPRIAAHDSQNCAELESELVEQRPPSMETIRAFPLRMVL